MYFHAVDGVLFILIINSAQLQEVQHRLPHSLDSDVLMANCTWEYMVLWNKDPEVRSLFFNLSSL